MNLAGYLIDHSSLALPELLNDWRWLVPAPASVWLMNRFAELMLVSEDGSVSYLETGAGVIRKIAADKDDFMAKLDESDNANDWLMIPLVDQCVAAGMTLGANQCYGFLQPTDLGGEYGVENIKVSDISIYLSAMGQIHYRTKDLSDGARIKFDVTD